MITQDAAGFSKSEGITLQFLMRLVSFSPTHYHSIWGFFFLEQENTEQSSS